MVTVTTPSTSGARNIHVMIEFLLIILTDVPKDLIHHDKLFDLLARVEELIREVPTLVHDLEEKSRNEESIDETSRATIDLLEEKIELLKEDLGHVYLKAPDSFQCCFPMNDGPLFMHLLLIHLNYFLDSNAYSITLIKDDIRLVKEALKFIRSFFVNVEQGLNKDLWARIFDKAYEAKHVIDSIIVRDNGLLHVIFSLPITIKKIKLIKEEVSNISEKITKNRSLTVVNSTKKTVESKSLTAGKIIVGFEEEKNWLISKLTSGQKDLDVISITGEQQLLTNISPDIHREYLIHLQENMVTVTTPSTSGARNIHVMIEFLLIILTDVPKDLIHHDKLFDLLARVEELIREVPTLVHDLEEKSRNEESIDETSRATIDLLEEKIELLKEDLGHVYLKAPDSFQCCFPMNDGPLFMHLLLIHLNYFLDSNAYSITLIKDDIRLVKEALKFIRSFFVNVEQGLNKDLWARIFDKAYEAKHVIDSIIVRDNGLLHVIFSLPITIKKIKLIKEEVSNISEKITKNRSLTVVNSTKKTVESKSLTAGKIIVGFEEEKNWLISKLTSGQKDLDVISITVTGSDLNFGEDIDVADKLRKQLYGKRYLIVLDDVWDTTTWDDLTRPFPEVEKGSRIILTTRQKEVSLHGKRNTDPLNLRLLRLEESWELLEKRAFGNESCLDELLEVGKEIAQNCKGLPLVVDLIAGVIAEREKKKTVWLEVRNNLNSFILSSEVDVMKKSTDICCKYIGVLKGLGMKSLEEVMEIYLDNLISSSLVIAFNEIGHYPTCQLHDLVHDFCLIKAKEEKLFEQISSSDPSSSSDLMPRMVSFNFNKEHFGPNNFVLFSSKKKRHSGKHLYSLLISGDKMENRLSDACHLRHLRLLRVLNLDTSFMMVKDSLLNEIGMLNHLRFVRSGLEVKSLPSSFSNLWNLQTLLVDNELSTLVLLPRLWDLAKLQVLSIGACSFYDMDTDEPIVIAEDSKLENLRVLDTLVVSYSKDIEDIFIRFPNLQRLVFDLKESWDYSKKRYWFPNFDFLTELEFLRVDFKSSNTNDSGPSLATNWP
ncbi:hypothetical protein CQW23_30699 [Capsicum baccatum]|uniref:NB-ARC domain-containing protein n=1 Tax=Capsicum baccatum TaxID=33114 RepID=A0A2G2V9R7_CAPBA|nr:hypothetical protein CQW23_30699 [Capsicum baccatum]